MYSPTDEKEENIKRLLKTALEMYEEHGIDGVTQEQLARASKLSTKSIQRYFANKSEIIDRITEGLVSRWSEEIVQTYYSRRTNEMTAAEKIILFMKIHNGVLIRDYKGQVFIQGADYHNRFYGKHNSIYHEKFRSTKPLQKGLEKLMNEGIADGSISCEIDINAMSKYLPPMFAGMIEHLAREIHSGEITLEEAEEYSNVWIMECGKTLLNK